MQPLIGHPGLLPDVTSMTPTLAVVVELSGQRHDTPMRWPFLAFRGGGVRSHPGLLPNRDGRRAPDLVEEANLVNHRIPIKEEAATSGLSCRARRAEAASPHRAARKARNPAWADTDAGTDQLAASAADAPQAAHLKASVTASSLQKTSPTRGTSAGSSAASLAKASVLQTSAESGCKSTGWRLRFEAMRTLTGMWSLGLEARSTSPTTCMTLMPSRSEGHRWAYTLPMWLKRAPLPVSIRSMLGSAPVCEVF